MNLSEILIDVGFRLHQTVNEELRAHLQEINVKNGGGHQHSHKVTPDEEIEGVLQICFLFEEILIGRIPLLEKRKLAVSGHLVRKGDKIPQVVQNIESFCFSFLVLLKLNLAPPIT